MKIFYRVRPDKYRECMDKIREKYGHNSLKRGH